MADDLGQSGRWAPFPVQDWSTMPPAPRPASVELSAPRFPPPAGRPAGRPRRSAPRWLPPLTVLMCLTLLAAGLHRADRVGSTVPDVVAHFVPADGAVSHASSSRSAAPGAEPVTVRTVTESFRRVGPEGLLSLDFTLGTEVIGSVGIERVRAVPFWRSTTTPVGPLPEGVPATQTTVVHDVSSAIELVAESRPEWTRTYTPALVELPADLVELDLAEIGASTSWGGSGMVGTAQPYRYAFTGRVETPECVRVQGEIVYAAADDAGSTRTVSRLWCAGQGLVAEDDSEGGLERRTHRAPATPVTVETDPMPAQWSDPSDWTLAEVAAVSEEPHLGEGQMAGSPGSLPPVLMTSGDLVRVSAGQDLVGFTESDDGAAVVSRWRAHPGGTVVSLTSFGDLLVAGTSERTVVGYGPRGVRLWTVAVPDVMFSSPALVGDLLLLTTISGDVYALDRHSGATHWQAAIRSEVAPATAVVADPERTVVMARSGDVVVLSTETGSELWRTEVEYGAMVALLSDQVVVAADQAVLALADDDGETRWRVRTDGTPYALRSGSDRVLVVAAEDLLSIDADGTVQWRRPADAQLAAAGEITVVLHGDRLEAVDAAGQTTASTPVRPVSAGSNRQLINGPDGVLFFDSVWEFWRWSG